MIIQTRRRFLKSAGASLASGIFTLSFPSAGRANVKSEQPNYIFINLNVAGIPITEKYREKINSAEKLKAVGYNVAFIENEYFCREPFYSQNQCAALDLVNIKPSGLAVDFSSFFSSLQKSTGPGDGFPYDAERYVLLNRNKPFCLFWEHTAVFSPSQFPKNDNANRPDESPNQTVIADIQIRSKNAINSLKRKLNELDIAAKTLLFLDEIQQT